MTATIMTRQGAPLGRFAGLAAAAIALLAFTVPAFAENILQQVRHEPGAGGQVDIILQFSGPVGDVQSFTTESPPRIAFDLADTRNGLSERRVVVGTGATSAVSAVEAGGRTRVVVDLFRPADYQTRTEGNNLVISVGGSQGGAAVGSTAYAADPSKRLPADVEVSNVDFRRGEDGSGRLIVSFNGDGADAHLRTEGDKLVLDVPNARLGAGLERRLDVVDFATPVQTIEPRAHQGATRFTLSTAGAYESMAYQTGNQYVLEVSPRAEATVAAPTGRPAPREYSGRPVTFNFQDIPVRTVLQLMAEESELNIVASDSVQGNVTLRLVNVPWDQAMDIVLRAKSLDQRRDGNVIWVAPQNELAAYEQAREDARIALEQRAELISEYVAINYGRAEDIASLLTDESKRAQGSGGAGGGQQGQQGFLSPRGSVSFDRRTNTLLIVDIPQKVDEIKALVAMLDRPVEQVLIEGRIVIATEDFARDLGVRLGASETNVRNPRGDFESGGFLVDMPLTNPAGAIGFSLLRGGFTLDLELQALQSEGRGEVISNPRIITANQQEAVIKQGDEIGYVTLQQGAGGTGNFTVEFKEVVLELRVTPTITQDDRVFLDMNIKKDEVEGFTTTPLYSVPNISKREITTGVLVDNGQTVVIGGVYEFSSREDLSKVPFLGDLPALGNLFRRKGNTSTKAELLVFVTPRILKIEQR